MARSVDSIGVQKQLNAMFEQRLDIENKILSAMQSELKTAMQLQAVLNDMTAAQLTEKLNEANKALEEMSAKAAETGDVGSKAMAGLSENAGKVSTNTSMISKTFTGISKVMGSMNSTALGVLGSMYKIGKAILSIPLDIFNNLMADAAAMSGDTSFLEALEKIRKEFGSFKEETSKNIVGAYKTVNTQLTQMSGLSVWQVFKTPADQLTYLHEIASKAGPMMHKFGEEMAKSGGAMVVFDKGMGIGAENMKGFMDRAAVLGTDLQTQLTSAGNQALQMGKEFGLSSKMISSDMGKMMKDVKNFGSMTQSQMAVSTVYTKKLGIEMKGILGTIEKFDNFDKAAESAALLSQAFGANVDAFKMMNEQDPAKRMDEMRKAMAAAGQTTEGMTRQQLKLLASTTGLTEEAAQLAFSSKNQGLSYEQVQKQASKAESAQMTQTKVMKGLSDNIERVVHAGQQIAGFWNNFVAGFTKGFKLTSEYRDLMFTLKDAMRQFYFAGMETGQLFMKLAPGVSEAFKSLTAVFSREKIKKLLFGFTGEFDSMKTRVGGVVGGFKEIFQGNLDKGFDTIKQSFNGFFSSAQIAPIANGIKKFGMFLAKSLGEALSTVAKNAPKYINQLTAFIKDPKGFIDSLKRGGSQGSGILQAIILSFNEGFSKNGPVMAALQKSLTDLLTAVWTMIKENPTVREAMKDYALFQIGKLMLQSAGSVATASSTIVKAMSTIGEVGVKALSGGFGAIGKAVASLGLAAAAAYAAWEGGKALGEAAMAHIEEVQKRAEGSSKSHDEAMDAIRKKRKAGISLGDDDIKALEAHSKELDIAQKKEMAMQEENNNSWLHQIKMGSTALVVSVATGTNAFKQMSEQEGQALSAIQAQQLDTVNMQIAAVTAASKINVDEMVRAAGVNQQAIGSTTAMISQSMPKLLAEFEKSTEGMKMSTADKTAAQEKFIKERVNSLAKSSEGAVMKMKADAAVEAKAAVDAIGLSADAFQKAYDSKFKLIMDAKIKAGAAEAAANGSLAGPGAASKPEAKLSEAKIAMLMSQKQTLEENINGLMKFADGGVIAKLNAALPKAGAALSEFNDKLSTSALNNTISATAGIVKSVNELGSILASGDGASMKIGEKLQRFANGAGLGKSGTYEIKNKGIMLKLELKIVMDAGEVEKAIVMRKDSILFDMLADSTSSLTDENARKVNEFKAKVGG